MDSQLRSAINERRPTVYAGVLLFSVIVTIGLTFMWLSRPIPFSSVLWKQNKNLRPRMVCDTLDTGDLLGRSRAEIDDLLGAPSGSDSDRRDRYIYWAGTAGIDDVWLELEFTDGHVSDVQH